jgi:thiol-disulfide isomerase/thioredoxin
MDTKPKGSVIRLSKYVGDMKVALDSMLYRGESEIGFTYDSRFSDGIYALDVNSLETFQFVIINQENISAHIYESGSGMAFKSNQSRENDAFNIMLNLSEVYSKSMDSMGIALNQLSDFDPRHGAKTDSLTMVYHRIADSYNNSLDLLNNLFPKSYTAEVLIALDKIPLRTQKSEWNSKFDNDAAFNHIHYFSFIDFSDERIITNPFLSNKVLDYIYNYSERSEQGLKQAIDKLVDASNTHPKVQAFIIDLLIDFFTDKEAAEFIDYISRTYLGSCALPLSESRLAKIDQMVKFKSGDPIPEFRLPNQTGHLVPVSGVTGQLNVIVFWASWCPHCMRELPKIKELYDVLAGDLGVYAISVDSVKPDWIQAVKSENLKWLNVIDEDGFESARLAEFGVTSTPTLILVDSELRWIGRASSFDGLYELVKAQLAE